MMRTPALTRASMAWSRATSASQPASTIRARGGGSQGVSDFRARGAVDAVEGAAASEPESGRRHEILRQLVPHQVLHAFEPSVEHGHGNTAAVGSRSPHERVGAGHVHTFADNLLRLGAIRLANPLHTGRLGE